VVGLTRIGVHLPERRASVEAVLSELERPPAEIRRYRRLYNLREVPVADEPIEGLLRRALADVAATEDLSCVGLVLYAHTILPQVPPDYDLLGRVLAPFGLDHLPRYGVAHVNCSALFRALQLACTYLERFPGRTVLVLAGDHASSLRQGRVMPGITAIGDAAIAFLVRPAPYRYRWLSAAWRQETAFHRGLQMGQDEAKAFNAVYAELLVDVVGTCLGRAGLALDDVDLILPHNVNEMTWVRFAREAGFSKSRIFLDLIPEIGHTLTTDAFLNLEAAMRHGRLAPGDRAVLTGVGLGSYFAAALVEVTDEATAA
jgi:3-oxoacyl-[acyl-carrier-protein] synthase-3